MYGHDRGGGGRGRGQRGGRGGQGQGGRGGQGQGRQPLRQPGQGQNLEQQFGQMSVQGGQMDGRGGSVWNRGRGPPGVRSGPPPSDANPQPAGVWARPTAPAFTPAQAPAPAQGAWGGPAPGAQGGAWGPRTPGPQAPAQGGAWGPRPPLGAQGPPPAAAAAPAPAPPIASGGPPPGFNNARAGASVQASAPAAAPAPAGDAANVQGASAASPATQNGGDAAEGGAVAKTDEKRKRRGPLPPGLFNMHKALESRQPDEKTKKPTKKGSSGTAVQLTTNYFAFNKRSKNVLMCYRADFSLEEDRTFVKKAMMRRCQDQINKTYVFDGSMLIAQGEIFPRTQKTLQLTSARRNLATQTEEVCIITLRLVSELFWTDHHYLQLYNIVFRQGMEGLNLKEINRNFYDSDNVHKFPQFNLELWPGYATSIRQHEDQVLLNTEIRHKFVRINTVYNTIQHIRAKCSDAGDARRQCESALLGAIIVSDSNKKTYRIDTIDWDSKPLTTFDKNGEQVTYKDYFLTRYGLKIRDDAQPLLESMPKERDRRGGITNPVKLIPELCRMTGLNDQERSNFKLTSALSRVTRQDPTTRMKNLTHFSHSINNTAASRGVLEKWGMELNKDPIRLMGRILQPREIHFGQGKKIFYDSHKADWGRGLREKMYRPVSISNWLVVYPKMAEAKMGGFLNLMRKVGFGLGVEFKEPRKYALTSVMGADYVTAVKSARYDFVLVVLKSNQDTALYSTVKKELCIYWPTPSQVITEATVLNQDSRKQMSIATKVVVQMSCKAGGTPWYAPFPADKDWSRRAMVCGFDTYHDAKKSNTSWGAFVHSHDTLHTQYRTSAKEHAYDEEMSNHMNQHMTEALKYWRRKHQTFPETVIFYRDGVGEGQYEQVLTNEVEAIEKVFKKGYGHFKLRLPNFLFIIVSKRISTRFFRPGARGGYDNPPSGTVVDDVVTQCDRYDFFLVSQSVNQGTVNPTSYTIIRNTSDLSAETIQRFTYHMTHLYFNWPGTVRVPAPCQYAHKMAMLAGESIHNGGNHHLQDTLFYL